MLRPVITLAQHFADNPVLVVAGGVVAAPVCAAVNLYYGYWFSHWRA
ncbi:MULTISPECIES: hypothetical protein [Pseudomonas]|nr:MULTISPECIES: hypothetical protein [Pseudomonas]